MRELHADVMAFHRKFNCTIGESPSVPAESVVKLRCELIDEEYRELMLAIETGDLAQIAKEGCDLIYVVVGTFIAFGIYPVPIWAAVQRANISKTFGHFRGDAKVLKGPGYVPPDIEGLIADQTPDASEVRS